MNRCNGYTLIQLLVVVAIMGLLGATAFPAYIEQLKDVRRADAQTALSGFAVAMERYFMEQSPPTYVNATVSGSGAGPGAPIAALYPSEAPLDGATKYYDLTVNSASASAYQLRAAPKGDQTGDRCGTLTLTATGQRGITSGGTGVTWQDCWD